MTYRIPYKGNLGWLVPRTIYYCVHGSRAYGTRRPDAKELLSIRDGAWSYDKLIGWADEMDAKLKELVGKTSLPKSPDLNKLDHLCIEIVQSMD